MPQLKISEYQDLYDRLIPESHVLRKFNNLVDFSFVRDEIEHKYCLDNGRNAISPVMLFKYLILKAYYTMYRRADHHRCRHHERRERRRAATQRPRRKDVCPAGHMAIRKARTGKKNQDKNQVMTYYFDVERCHACPQAQGCYKFRPFSHNENKKRIRR